MRWKTIPLVLIRYQNGFSSYAYLHSYLIIVTTPFASILSPPNVFLYVNNHT